jgi:hypothetical protein
VDPYELETLVLRHPTHGQFSSAPTFREICFCTISVCTRWEFRRHFNQYCIRFNTLDNLRLTSLTQHLSITPFRLSACRCFAGHSPSEHLCTRCTDVRMASDLGILRCWRKLDVCCDHSPSLHLCKVCTDVRRASALQSSGKRLA